MAIYFFFRVFYRRFIWRFLFLLVRVFMMQLIGVNKNKFDSGSLKRCQNDLDCNLIIAYFNSFWVKGALFSVTIAYKVEWKKYFERTGGTMHGFGNYFINAFSVHLTWSPSKHMRVTWNTALWQKCSRFFKMANVNNDALHRNKRLKYD